MAGAKIANGSGVNELTMDANGYVKVAFPNGETPSSLGGVGEVKSTGATKSPDPTQIIADGIFTLNQGDTIRPVFSNVDGTSDIIVSTLSVRLRAI